MSPSQPSDSDRKIDVSIEIDAPADAVWKALTDAEELKRWFPLDARVKPGVGGTVWLSWGAPFEGEAPIAVWKPGERFGWVEERPAADPMGAPVRIAVDVYLESRGGKTILRLVQSGFGNGANWDDEFESTSQGWGWFLAAMRHYLQSHRGRARTATWAFAAPPLSRAETWTAITGPSGFASASGPLEKLRAGDRYALDAGPLRLEGRVLVSQRDYHFGGTVENLGNGLVYLEINRMGGATAPSVLLSTFGEPTAATRAAHDAFRARFAALFPAA